MKLYLFGLLALFTGSSLFGMEEQPEKKAKADGQLEAFFQPKSLRDTAASLGFRLLPGQTQLDERLGLLPSDITERYINEPVDRTGRTPIFFATAENIPIILKRGAQLDHKDNVEHATCIEYLLMEGKCNAAAEAIWLFFGNSGDYDTTRLQFKTSSDANKIGSGYKLCPHETLRKKYPIIFRTFYTLVRENSERLKELEHEKIFRTNPEEYLSAYQYSNLSLTIECV